MSVYSPMSAETKSNTHLLEVLRFCSVLSTVCQIYCWEISGGWSSRVDFYFADEIVDILHSVARPTLKITLKQK